MARAGACGAASAEGRFVDRARSSAMGEWTRWDVASPIGGARTLASAGLNIV